MVIILPICPPIFITGKLYNVIWFAETITTICCLLQPHKVKKNSSPPLSLYGQLLWREFFYTAATNNPCFDKMESNPICVQIPWDRNPEALAKWAEGRTGFPWIDAIMTQLRQEGWIHHLARHAVACFLTRGDLWIGWEEGMKVDQVFSYKFRFLLCLYVFFFLVFCLFKIFSPFLFEYFFSCLLQCPFLPQKLLSFSFH